MKAIPLLLLGMFAWIPGEVGAQGSGLTLSQLNHRLFTALDEAPTDINALAQTSEGTLWIGGRTGLTRFDGMHFVSYPAPGEEALPGTNIASLFADAHGGLWIGFRPGGAAELKRGRVTRYGEAEGLPDGTVEQFVRDRRGVLWAATRRGLASFDGARWTRHDDARIESPYWLLVDREGTLWVGASNGLFAWVAGERQFREIDRSLKFGAGGVSLAEAPDGSIWAAPHHKLVRVHKLSDARVRAAVTFQGISSGPLLFDEPGNLWASESGAKSLLRVRSDQLAAEETRPPTLTPERLGPFDESNFGRVFAVIQDRERNIWVGTDNGLHRFSRSNVVRGLVPRCFQYGFTAAGFAAGDNGSLWIACGDPSGSRVDEIRDNRVVSSQPSEQFSVAYRDTEGTVWFAGDRSLAHIEDGKLVSMPLPSDVQGRPIAALVRERNGAMWVSVTRRTLFRFHEGTWTEYGGLEDLPRGWPIVSAIDDNGVLWFGYSNSRVARVSGREVSVFDAARGLEVGNVLAILAQRGEVWVGGELGFARLEDSRAVMMRGESGTPFKGVSGIVRARNGDLWLNGIGGILRIDADELEAQARVADHALKIEMFNYLDGVPGTAVQLRPQPSAIETTDGRIWFSMTAGLVSIDATQLVRNHLPPPVTIWSLTANSRRYPNFGDDLGLPINTTDLQIEYGAGSLSVPERVRFRYKLEGSDQGWQDAGARREALYTNLGPGRYTFRVTASNNDGVWNESGAALNFTIAPAFYQTWYFYSLGVLAALALLAMLYRMRVRQVAAQVRARLEARLSERERIARELHDTLLQGVQGLIWRFQAATDRIPAGEPARRLMEQSLDRADKLLGESRDRVKDLRPTTRESPELSDVLAAEGEHLSQQHGARYRVSVQGTSRDLHPIAREEVLLIAREALGNAFRHANAQTIEVDLTYGDAALQLRIRDDGGGIHAAVLDAGGRPGHFGLIGMRERANKLGASLDIWSKPGAGTEVDLRVPAKVAYGDTRKTAYVGAA
jgi:signal transduction histidine kinase/ligand-binding sensor domain-containing protein